MKATETTLFKFLEGNKQFIIPIYQRTYSWMREQCEQLWLDIVHAATHEAVKAHFVGSIVYIQDGIYQATALPQMLVIDGQQRLTTLTLLLTAVAQAADGDLTVSAEEITDYYLLNRHGKGDLRYKLELTQSDRDTLRAIVSGKALPSAQAPRIAQNFAYFVEQIRKAEITLDALYQGIGKLVVVDIALDRSHDNPQLIFESLNSTGLALSQADLIRNYILMRLDTETQQALYTEHWFPMEQLFGIHYTTHFDRFMRDYLTIMSRSGAIPRINEVYNSFKLYREKLQDTTDIGAIVADIHHFARLFVNAAGLRKGWDGEPDEGIRAALDDIDALEVDVAYPFLLEAYQDYTRGTLARDDFLAILRLIESYVFRRAVCGIPTNSMNKTFATLMRDVDKTRYRASVEQAFMALPHYRRFPRDDEFRRDLIAKDVYNFQRRKYLLRKLENHGRKERVIIDGCTIEHIMPQNPNLSAAWQTELGAHWQDVQSRYLHTIGNLTLTGYNSEMSDRAFQDKRDMPEGFAHSPLHLNEGLGALDHWNENAIQERGRRLVDRAVEVWAAPQVPEQVAHRAQRNGGKYTLAQISAQTPPQLAGLLIVLHRRILNIDSGVQEIYYKQGISYAAPDQFAWVQPRQTQLSVGFWARLDAIDDPDDVCRHTSAHPTSGKYWYTFPVKTSDRLEYAMYLIEQSFLLHQSDAEATEEDEAPVGAQVNQLDDEG